MAGDPSGLEGTLEALARIVVSVESSREASMAKIAELGCGLLESCDFASVTLMERDRPRTASASDDDATGMDEAQYEGRSGPCLAAIHDQRVVRTDSLAGEQSRWGELVAAAAVKRNVGSSLSAPLIVDGSCLGGLNLYSRAVGAFSSADEQTIAAFAHQAAIVAANARDYWNLAETTHQLESALQSRAIIEQAKGVLIARQGCSPDEAFDVLRRASQRNNRKLREIAEEIVTEAASRRGDRDV
jgi:GAF domain-containing protein